METRSQSIISAENLTTDKCEICLLEGYYSEKFDPKLSYHGVKIFHSERFNKKLCLKCQNELAAEEDKKLILKDHFDNPEKYMEYNVPKKYLFCSLENFQNNQKLIYLIKEYLSTKPLQSLLITGTCGCGKTHISIAIIRELIKSGLNFKDKSGTLIEFITVPELLLKIRSTYSKKNDNWNDEDTEESFINKYSNIKYLILDDLGVEKTSDWSLSTLYLIIDRRYRDEKTTIVTSNLSIEEISDKLGNRIASRLSESKVISIDMPDYRKKR